MAFNSELWDWNDIVDDGWNSLLLGNGASCAIWKHFKYSSLFKKAAKNGLFRNEEEKLFKKLKTDNFETVIDALSVSSTVCRYYKITHRDIKKSRKNIRGTLINTVKDIHIPWVLADHSVTFEKTVLEIVGEELIKYRNVFTTNYDLIAYWSLMALDNRLRDKVNDCFRAKGKFEENYKSSGTNLLFLHGGLHLYLKPDGTTIKRRAQDGLNLLDLFSEDYEGAKPLLIAEGSFEEKLKQIQKSDYLRYAHEIFRKRKGSLIVFGHSLDKEKDGHITNLLKRWKEKKIAVSLHAKKPMEIISEKRRICHLLGCDEDENIFFFDSRTHPLGSEQLKIQSSEKEDATPNAS